MNDTVVVTLLATAASMLRLVEPCDDKRDMQDCEIEAFKRTAPVRKSLLKKHPICLVDVDAVDEVLCRGRRRWNVWVCNEIFMHKKCCVATSSSPSNAGWCGSAAGTPSLRKCVRNHICVLRLSKGKLTFAHKSLVAPNVRGQRFRGAILFC